MECNHAYTRNKQSPANFYDILLRDDGTKFVDSTFSGSAAMYWKGHGENYGKGWSYEYDNGLTWERASTLLAGHSLFGNSGISPNDVRQGGLGDCWFKSAIAALAEWPGRIE